VGRFYWSCGPPSLSLPPIPGRAREPLAPPCPRARARPAAARDLANHRTSRVASPALLSVRPLARRTIISATRLQELGTAAGPGRRGHALLVGAQTRRRSCRARSCHQSAPAPCRIARASPGWKPTALFWNGSCWSSWWCIMRYVIAMSCRGRYGGELLVISSLLVLGSWANI